MRASKRVSLLLAATFAAIAGTAYGAQPPDVGVSGVTTAWLERRSRAAAMPCPNRRATIRHNFRGSTRDCGSDGYPTASGRFLLRPAGCERSDWPGSLRRIGQQPLRRIYEAGHPCCADDRGRILGSGRRPVRGSTSLRSIPPSSSIPPRVDGMQLLSTSRPTASRGARDRPENRRLQGRRSDRRLHRLEDPTARCEGRGR